MLNVNKHDRSQSGVVLVLVVIVITIITTIVVDFIFRTQIDYEISSNTANQLKARYIAQSGVNVFTGVLKNASLEEIASAGAAMQGVEVQKTDIWELRVPMFPVGDGHVTIVAEDERSKLNLNALVHTATNRVDFQVLTALDNLFTMLGVDQNQSQLFLSSLINWLDRPLEGTENNQDPRGADDSFYRGLDTPYAIKDGPLDSVAEIRMIHGMDEEFYNTVKDYLTVYPPDKQINFTTASRPVMLAALRAAEVSIVERRGDQQPKIDDRMAEIIVDNIIEKRQQQTNITRQEVRDAIIEVDTTIGIRAGLTGVVLNSGSSETFTISSTGFIGLDTTPVISHTEAVIMKSTVGRSSEVDIISWKQR